MQVFPSSPTPIYPLSIKQKWRNLRTDFDSGFSENRRQLWSYPRRSLSLKFDVMTDIQIAILWDFYTARKGSMYSFWFFWPLQTAAGLYYSYINEYVARGNGSLITFDMPSKNTDLGSVSVFINGVATQVSTSAGTGDASVDQIIFNTTGAITTSSIANPSIITTSLAHGLTSANKVVIAGHSDATVNGTHIVTVLSSTTFSIPVNVTVGGTGGTWTMVAPDLGAFITANFTGQIGYRVRFNDDDMDKELFNYILYNTGIDLIEVRT